MTSNLHKQPSLHNTLRSSSVPFRSSLWKGGAKADPDSMELVNHVRFDDSQAMSTSLPSPLDVLMQENEMDDFAAIWYQHEEITVFRDEARDMCLQMRRLIEAETTVTTVNSATVSSSAIPATASPSSTHSTTNEIDIPTTSVASIGRTDSGTAIASTTTTGTVMREPISPSRSRRRGLTIPSTIPSNLTCPTDVSNVPASPTSSPKSTRTPLLARNDRTRGLERRACPERHRRTYLSLNMILKGARKFQNHQPDKLAALASKCTAWATTLAVEEGHRDQHRALYDDDSITMNDEESINDAVVSIGPLLLQENPTSSPVPSPIMSSKRMRFRSSNSTGSISRLPSSFSSLRD